MQPSRLTLSSARRPRRSRRGVTLIEVSVAAAVMAVSFAGLFSAFIQARRLTEGSIYQNSALTVLQGYIEQMKNMEFAQLSLSPVPTRLADGVLEPLYPTTSPMPSLASLPLSWTAPTGVVSNLKSIDVNCTPTNPADDLQLNVWLWVNDLTGTASDVTLCKEIVLVYTWKVPTGNGASVLQREVVRTVRSYVPTL